MSSQKSEGHLDVSVLVSSIPALARRDLIGRWEAYYGAPPHRMISTRLLVLAVAYATQVEQHGGLARHTRKQILRLAEAAGASLEAKSAEAPYRQKIMRPGFVLRPRSGTRFVREWNGRSHVVEVLDKGFAWQGKTYRSLSAIATLITGTRWSGPRFFGVAS